MNYDEDVQMGGVNGRIIKVQEFDNDNPLGIANALMDGKTTKESSEMSNSPGPAQLSRRSLPTDGYQDTASDEDGTSTSQVSLAQNGTQLARPFYGVVIESLPVTSDLPYSSQRTGLVYDARMRFHTELEIDEEEDIHPEDPRRIYEIYKDLVSAGLVDADDGKEIDERLKPYKMLRIPTREAEAAEICLVHSVDHYMFMTSLKDKKKEDLVELGKSMDSLYLHSLTFFCAKLSAGGAIEACRAVAGGRVKNAMAVIRPPGHHAEHNKPGGFCFFDNVAIAAKVCQRDFGDKCRKILILDWDVHHGNGVQMAFEDDPNVLYISLHVHTDGKFYPSGNYGDHLHVGYGAGEGKNINIPWKTNGMTDGDYMYAFQNIVMPVAYEFNPDLVIISAGFDAAEGDMLGGCHVSPAGFAHMTHMLMSLAKGKVVACLEGGYNLRAIARSALAVTRTLMGEPPDRLPDDTEASREAVDICNLVIRTHARYWKCLYPKTKAAAKVEDMGGDRLHDLLRMLQAQEYCAKFKMADLWIMREKLSTSFDRQVLATANYTEARPLLIMFHDPPETWGEQNSHTGNFDPHNVIVTDVAKQYIEWAINNKFAVIDINVPKFITPDKKQESREDDDPNEERLQAMKDCAMYLWENHVEPYDSSAVFLIGVGDAAAAVTHLLSTAKDAQDRITWVFNFTCEHDLRAVQRPGDDYFADWYFKHSDNFVAHDHQAWNPERTKRVRRKYGSLRRSEYNELNEILLGSKNDVTQRIMHETQEWREEEKVKAEAASASAAAPANNTRLPSIRSSQGLQFGDELRPGAGLGAASSHLGPSSYAHQPYGTSPQFGAPPDGRNSPGASPRVKSPGNPNRLPPMGMFFTSPERRERERREGGRRSGPASPSRRI